MQMQMQMQMQMPSLAGGTSTRKIAQISIHHSRHFSLVTRHSLLILHPLIRALVHLHLFFISLEQDWRAWKERKSRSDTEWGFVSFHAGTKGLGRHFYPDCRLRER